MHVAELVWNCEADVCMLLNWYGILKQIVLVIGSLKHFCCFKLGVLVWRKYSFVSLAKVLNPVLLVFLPSFFISLSLF